jgi:hypothetical protein
VVAPNCSKLALRARLAVIAAGELDPDSIRAVLRSLKQRAHGHGHVANGAAKNLLDLAQAAVEDDPVADDTKPLAEMTPAEEGALLARIDKDLARYDEGEDGDGDQADPAGATFPPMGS